MARGKREVATRDISETSEQGIIADLSGQETATKKLRRKKDVAMSRITLSLPADLTKKLRHAAIEQGLAPCEIVEGLLEPAVRQYVLSIRNRRPESEPGEAA